MRIVPLTLKQANLLVAELHRHHRPVVGHRFSLGCYEGEKLVGAAIIGRPVARMIDDGVTAEVTRLVTDGTPNACSMLYGAAWRAWSAMGGTRMRTYTLVSETGSSLRGAGWKLIGETAASKNGWSAPSRPRVRFPHDDEAKSIWEKISKGEGK